MGNKEDKVAEAFVKAGFIGCFSVIIFPFFIALGFVISIINGYVIRQYWEWFIVPGFGVNQISLFTSVAACHLISYIMFDITITREYKMSIWITSLLRPAVFYGVGYVWFWYGQNILTNFGFSS